MSDEQLEKHLRDSLRRIEPPDGFTERVMSRVPAASPRRAGLRASPWLQWLPAFRLTPVFAALLITVLIGGLWQYEQRRERTRKAERARAELTQALRITAVQLERTRARLLRQKERGGRAL